MIQHTKHSVIQADRAFESACLVVEALPRGSAEHLKAIDAMSAALDAYNAAEKAHNAAVDMFNAQRAARAVRN